MSDHHEDIGRIQVEQPVTVDRALFEKTTEREREREKGGRNTAHPRSQLCTDRNADENLGWCSARWAQRVDDYGWEGSKILLLARVGGRYA